MCYILFILNPKIFQKKKLKKKREEEKKIEEKICEIKNEAALF